STRHRPAWSWRIVNYAGDTVEESEATYATIGGAVEEGAKRRERMNVVDRSARPSPYPRGASRGPPPPPPAPHFIPETAMSDDAIRRPRSSAVKIDVFDNQIEPALK